MFISETHYTNKGVFKLTAYVIYDTKHPYNAHGRIAILIKKMRNVDANTYKSRQ